MKPVFSGLLALMTFVGCGTPTHVREFAAIGSVTSITVSRHSDPPETAKITGKAAISEVVDFVDAHRTGWRKPWSGIPIPAVTVEFYDGTEFKGSFGCADNFFETQRDGGFFSQSASPAEVLEFIKLVSFQSDSTIISNEREHVLDGDFRIITTVGELPTRLKTAFAALTKESRFEMADPGHAFLGGD